MASDFVSALRQMETRVSPQKTGTDFFRLNVPFDYIVIATGAASGFQNIDAIAIFVPATLHKLEQIIVNHHR